VDPLVSGVLFSAGRGERLRPLTHRVSKAVLPILDVPLGAFGLSRLTAVCSNVIVNVQAGTRMAIEAALTGAVPGAAIGFIEESPAPFGAAGTLAAVRDRLGGTVVTWNADVISDLAVNDLMLAHQAENAPATIAIRRTERNADVSFERRRATGYINRHERSDASGGQFIGIAVFERSVVDGLSDDRPAGLAEMILEPLVRGGELAVYKHPGYAIDVGTFPRYLEASGDVLRGRGVEPPMPVPGAIVRLASGAAYIGPGAAAAPGTLGSGAILLEGSEVREGSFVERSIVGAGTVVPQGEVVRDAVWPWFHTL
jgi:mannose-1-phosphate guanylyltransferase